MTSPSCARPACSGLPAAWLAYDYEARCAWLDDQLETGEDRSHRWALCERHANALRVPRGWFCVDRRLLRGGVTLDSNGDEVAVPPKRSGRKAATSGAGSAGSSLAEAGEPAAGRPRNSVSNDGAAVGNDGAPVSNDGAASQARRRPSRSSGDPAAEWRDAAGLQQAGLRQTGLKQTGLKQTGPGTGRPPRGELRPDARSALASGPAPSKALGAEGEQLSALL
ncbi:MAG TPA: DUF3499 family protein [Acidimicrobiales bacterium]|nr:DUF3499 family protein [Acidimicrobiales bacterium]